MNDDTRTEAIALCESRAGLYRLIATLYFQPLSQEQIDALAASDIADAASEEGSPFAIACADLSKALRLRHSGTKETLAADYTGAFYGIRTVSGRTAQPFQSLFEANALGLMGEARSEVYRTLKAHALRVPAGADLPEDHLSFICEYLAFLCDETAATLREQRDEDAASLIRDQRAFFETHVASWFPTFHAIADQIVETRFYRGVLNLTEAFIAEEAAMLDDLERLLS